MFRVRGFHATSVKEVTSAASATIGSLYHFFPQGKGQLTAEVLREMGASYLELFLAFAAIGEAPGDIIQQFFDGAATTLVETGYVDICPVGSIAREVASSDDSLRAVAAEVFASWEHAVTALFISAGAQDEAASALAATVIAAIEGGFTLCRIEQSPEPLHRIGLTLRRTIEAALDQPA